MRIALDYDRTFTADPELWGLFVQLCKLQGHDLSLSAPTGQKPRAWTVEERDDFRRVMEEAAAREAALKR